MEMYLKNQLTIEEVAHLSYTWSMDLRAFF